MRQIFTIVGGIAIIGAVAGVALSQAMFQRAPAKHATIEVAATFYPLAYIASAIGGDAVTVTTITPAGAEPHDFEPTPRDVVMVESADLVLMSGTVVDAWATRLHSDLLVRHIPTLIAADSIQLVTTASSSDTELPVGVSDPHFWQDPTLMQTVGQAVAQKLMALDPTHANGYTLRAAEFQATMQSLDQAFTQGLRNCLRREIVVSHDAFRYVAHRYQLQSVAIAGISSDAEPSPQQLASIIDTVKATHTTTIFFEPLVSPALANTVASGAGVSTAILNPIEGLTAQEMTEHKNYANLMRENLAALRIALLCQ